MTSEVCEFRRQGEASEDSPQIVGDGNDGPIMLFVGDVCVVWGPRLLAAICFEIDDRGRRSTRPTGSGPLPITSSPPKN